MITGEIHILPTDNTPEFLFRPDGIIKIIGRGLIGNKSEVTEQIGIWIDEYVTKPAETTYVIIAFEYLNSFCTTILVSILRKFSQVLLHSGKLVIQWYYEEDDEDMLEAGEDYESIIRVPFKMIEIVE